MRQLTKKQRTLLTDWYRVNNSLYSWNDLTLEQIEALETINDTEILQQEVNRFLGDLYYGFHRRIFKDTK